MELEKHYTKRLKKILHSKKTYFCLTLLLAFYELYFLSFPKPKEIKKEERQIIAKIKDYKWMSQESIIQIEVTLENEKYLATYNYQEKESAKLKEIVQYGNTVKITGEFYLPEQNTIPNTFNYKKYLQSKKIDACIKIKEIIKIKSNFGFQKWRQRIRNHLNTCSNSPYIKMLILGIKEDFPKQIDNLYRENGISHIFVISGLHLITLYELFKKITSKVTKKEILKYLLPFLGLSCYVSLLSDSISSRRVYYFYGLSTINKIGKLDLNNKQLFFLDLIIILFQNPYLPYQIGFQYSFLLSFTFIFLKSEESRKIYALLKSSILAFIVSAPITINSNFSINPWSILLNVIMIPLITKVLFPSLLLSIFSPKLGFFATILIKIINSINNLVSALPFAQIAIPKIPIILFLFYYLILFLFLSFRRFKFFILLLIVCLGIYFYPKLNPNSYIYFLDVGQGDSTLIIFPYQKDVILMDTGKESANLNQNIITFLKSLGISKINYHILSHGDFDHIGNSINLVNNFKVEKVIFNHDEYNELEIGLIKILKEKNILYYKNIKELSIKNNKFYFLNTKLYDNENDNSNVIYTNINQIKILFMGDSSINREQDILNKYNIKKIDILKVGHHGSDTSTSKNFLNVINPTVSIISVGKNNKYGHPKDSVLKNLSNSKIYRTDINGSIKIKVNKRGYKISSYAS